MDNKFKVSIITVCLNSEKTIRRTIEHILHQTYSNIEYIVIDGGSTDSTVDIIKEYEKPFGGRLKWISEKDNGIYDAMNKGIEMSTGDLIGISNSDDWLELDAVELVTERFNPLYDQVIYGFIAMWNTEGLLKRIVFINHENLKEENLPHPTCFISKSTYRKIGLYSSKYKLIADYEFLLKAFLNGSIVFSPVYKLIANFTEGGASFSIDCEKEVAKLKREYRLIDSTKYYCKMLYLYTKGLIKRAVNYKNRILYTVRFM